MKQTSVFPSVDRTMDTTPAEQPIAAMEPGRNADRAPANPADGIDVWFAPYAYGNPYQHELAGALRSHGFNVVPRKHLRGLLGERLFRRTRTRLIHLHWLPYLGHGWRSGVGVTLFAMRLLALRLAGLRFVWTVHNLYPHDGLENRAEWLVSAAAALAADEIVVHSPAARDLLTRELFVRRSTSIHTIPHGNYIASYPNQLTQAAARARLGIDVDAPVFLFFGHLRGYKGLDHLIAAFKTLAAEQAVLIIAGQPGLPETVDALQRDIGSDGRIRLRPAFVPTEEVQLYFNAADVVVLPYRQVLTSGGVVLAMSFGKACVAPRIGSIPDVLDERGGFIYDARDPVALSSALERALHSRDELAAMGAYNRRRAQAWGWDVVGEATVGVYAAALGLRSR